jgi:hypothetical protein
MTKSIKYSIVILSAVIVAGCMGYGLSRLMKVSFFLRRANDISVMGFKIHSFQPIALGAYEKNGGLFLRVAYFDRAFIPRIVSIWISGKYKQINLDETYYLDNQGNTLFLKDVKTVDKLFKLGTRIRADIITGEKIDNAYNKEGEESCAGWERLCQLRDFVDTKKNIYENFWSIRILPMYEVLPVLNFASPVTE